MGIESAMMMVMSPLVPMVVMLAFVAIVVVLPLVPVIIVFALAGVVVVFSVVAVIVMLAFVAVPFGLVLVVTSPVTPMVIVLAKFDRIDPLGRDHTDALEVGRTDEPVEPALKLQPIDDENLGLAHRTHVGRGRLIDVGCRCQDQRAW